MVCEVAVFYSLASAAVEQTNRFSPGGTKVCSTPPPANMDAVSIRTALPIMCFRQKPHQSVAY